jgi:hypothetical protein
MFAPVPITFRDGVGRAGEKPALTRLAIYLQIIYDNLVKSREEIVQNGITILESVA